MPRFSTLLSRSIFAGIFLAALAGTTAVDAETYKSGQFTLTDTDDGYRVCKPKGKCVLLNSNNFFIKGRDDGYRWQTWQVGQKFYSVSSLESDESGKERYFSYGNADPKYKLIFKGKLISVTESSN
jgi:hypothetical protein